MPSTGLGAGGVARNNIQIPAPRMAHLLDVTALDNNPSCQRAAHILLSAHREAFESHVIVSISDGKQQYSCVGYLSVVSLPPMLFLQHAEL